MEIHLAAMKPEESRYVIERGMGDLKIAVSDDLTDAIGTASVGSPALLQYLCLDIAEAAFGRSPRQASMDDFRQALKDYVRLKSKRLHALYAKAIETIGPKRYRKQILHAMSEIEDEYVTLEQIRTEVSAQLGEEVPSTALSGPLRDLKSNDYGPVLKDVERHVGGERVYNYTTFVDPAMKSFIRLFRAGQDKGVFSE